VRRLSLDLGPYTSLCVESDDALDALVAAMTARSIALGHWRQPVDEEETARAATEGWICVPSGTVWSLVGTPTPAVEPTAVEDIVPAEFLPAETLSAEILPPTLPAPPEMAPSQWEPRVDPND